MVNDGKSEFGLANLMKVIGLYVGWWDFTKWVG